MSDYTFDYGGSAGGNGFANCANINNAASYANNYPGQRANTHMGYARGAAPQFVMQVGRNAFVYRGLVAKSNAFQQQQYGFPMGMSASNAYQNINYTNFRIREIVFDRVAAQVENFIFEGNPPVYDGDDVTVYARRRHDGMHATRIALNDTGRVIYPNRNLPLAFGKAKLLIIVAIVVFLIIFVASGGLLGLVSLISMGLLSLIVAALPILFIGGLFWFLFKGFFRR